MGTVWRGWDEVLRRPAAIKEVRFPPGVSRAERDSLYWRTLREARAAAQLSHPAVTTVHDVVVTCSRIQASISGRAPHSSTLG